MNQRLNILIIASALALLPICVMAEDTNALATLQKSFSKQEQALMDGYDTALGTMMAESKKNGDIDLYLVVEAERKRFETEKTIPALADVNISFRTPVGSYYKQRVGIFKKQVSALDALMKSEMQADRMESAKALKAEKDKVAFELADLESKLPQPTAKKGDTKAPAPSRLFISINRQDSVIGGLAHKMYQDGRLREAQGATTGAWIDLRRVDDTLQESVIGGFAHIQYQSGKLRECFGPTNQGAWIDLRRVDDTLQESVIGGKAHIQYQNGKLRERFGEQVGAWITIME